MDIDIAGEYIRFLSITEIFERLMSFKTKLIHLLQAFELFRSKLYHLVLSDV